MTDLTPADVAAFDALKETCRAQSLKLDAARERIAELETISAIQETELAAKDKTIAEQRALLAHSRTSLSEQFNDPMQGDTANGAT